MRLGLTPRTKFRTGKVRPKAAPLPQRPNVHSEGDELEVVWYPHRDALSLLPEDSIERRTGQVEHKMPSAPRLPRFSWFG